MSLNKFLKITLCVAIPTTLLPLLLIHFTKKSYKKLLRSHAEFSSNTYYKLIFTTYNKNKCKYYIYKQKACREDYSVNMMTTLLSFFKSAKHSISLCMHFLTVTKIQDALIKAHSLGVKIRFISDSQMLQNSFAQRSSLKNAGIPIKTEVQEDTLLHHKFCLIDEDYPEAQMFFGSLNLTLQAMTRNFDLIVFTNDQTMIRRYKDHFNYLWDNLIEL